MYLSAIVQIDVHTYICGLLCAFHLVVVGSWLKIKK